jgi:hypothetical protein
MHRIQVQLTKGQERALRKLAAARGSSISALIREGVDGVISERGRRLEVDRALAAIGKFRSGLSDVSERHDEYLTEDIAERKTRRRR